jgi:hypothetical protein
MAAGDEQAMDLPPARCAPELIGEIGLEESRLWIGPFGAAKREQYEPIR